MGPRRLIPLGLLPAPIFILSSIATGLYGDDYPSGCCSLPTAVHQDRAGSRAGPFVSICEQRPNPDGQSPEVCEAGVSTSGICIYVCSTLFPSFTITTRVHQYWTYSPQARNSRCQYLQYYSSQQELEMAHVLAARGAISEVPYPGDDSTRDMFSQSL